MNNEDNTYYEVCSGINTYGIKFCRIATYCEHKGFRSISSLESQSVLNSVQYSFNYRWNERCTLIDRIFSVKYLDTTSDLISSVASHGNILHAMDIGGGFIQYNVGFNRYADEGTFLDALNKDGLKFYLRHFR